MTKITPYGLKRRPDQTTAQLNKVYTKQNNEQYSKTVYNQDRSKAIIIGVQPNGEFGIRRYAINGDTKTEEARLW